MKRILKSPALILLVGAIFVGAIAACVKMAVPNLGVSNHCSEVVAFFFGPYLLLAFANRNQGDSAPSLLPIRMLTAATLAIGPFTVALEVAEVYQVFSTARPVQVSGALMLNFWLVMVQYLLALLSVMLFFAGRAKD